MKRFALTILLLLFSLSDVFAKDPEIVNPPRPSSNFRWIIAVKYEKTERSLAGIQYFYADAFRIEFYETLNANVLVLDSNSEQCLPFGSSEGYCFTQGPGLRVILEYTDSKHLKQGELLVAKAPSPRKQSEPKIITKVPVQTSIYLPQPIKARVVFKK